MGGAGPGFETRLGYVFLVVLSQDGENSGQVSLKILKITKAIFCFRSATMILLETDLDISLGEAGGPIYYEKRTSHEKGALFIPRNYCT
jgi:hypothetical protein